MREATRRRETREAAIELRVALDAVEGRSELLTGWRFFDHMLGTFAFYGGVEICGSARSLDGIAHHLIEDVALTLGTALAGALGARSGIERFGCAYVPMDDALARAVVDLSGRPFSRIVLPLGRDRVEDLDTQLVPHFFRSLAQTLGATLHLDLLAGEDDHHAIEAAFKACARACKQAWSRSPSGAVLSTKGILG